MKTTRAKGRRGVRVAGLSCLLLLTTVALCASAAEGKKGDKKEAAAPQPYPLKTCLVSGKKLPAGAAPVAIVHEGRTIKFCCRDCVAAFKKDPAKYLGKLDAALIAAQKETYPLTTCPVTGAKLGKMGKTIDYLHHGRLVRFCCKGCVAKFKKNPAPYLRKLDEAALAKQKAEYPLDTCPVTGAKLGKMGKTIDYLHHGRLVRFCCKGCVRTFKKNPAPYLRKLDEAAAKKRAAKKDEDN